MTDTNAMADLVGPFYASETVAALLGCSGKALGKQATADGILALTTSDGVVLYPAFQFTPDGTLRPELPPVLRTFEGCPPWSVAVWLRTRNEDLDDTTPEQWLASKKDPHLVRDLARHQAFAWSA